MIMDRIDAMKVFIAALDEGSLAGAARKLGRSPAAVSRAMAFLEAHVGAPLLHRTTRSIKLSEAGERYASACRRVLSDLEEADMAAAGERSAPRGTLTLTAPVVGGEDILRPIVDAFLDEVPTVSVRLYLLDRPANLIEEGIDVALRFAHLTDSTLVATRVGEVRRVRRAAISGVASADRAAGRPRAAADHRHDPLRPGVVEFPPARGLRDPAHGSVRAAPGDQQCPRRRDFGRGGARRDPAVLLPYRPAADGRRPGDHPAGA
jgi:DNA-binding transcriptional LysR family regulator